MAQQVRVRDLAEELGVTVEQVLSVLTLLGTASGSISAEMSLDPESAAYVRSSFTRARQARSGFSTVDASAAPVGSPPTLARPPLARPVPGPGGGGDGKEARLRWAEQQLGAAPGSTPRPARDPRAAFAEAARALGADPDEVPRLGRGSSRRPAPASHRPAGSPARTRTGALSAALVRRWQLRPDAARELSDVWLPVLLAAGGELSTLEAFWSAGFGRGQHRLVEQCLTYGIGPEDLATRVDGRRIGEAILGGASAALLARRLRDD